MSRFAAKYAMGLELHSSPPIVIREADGHNGRKFIVKVFCKGNGK